MDIPIQNVYYLLCYAWDHWEEGQAVDVSGVESPELADLFATVLVRGTRHLLRRGLDRGYVAVSEDTSRLRGRIDFGTSVKRTLLHAARAHCHYDELSSDVLHNRILKSTLLRLASIERLDAGLRGDLLRLHRGLVGVSDVAVSRLSFRRVQLHSGNAFYRFLMNVCELVLSNVFVDERTGRHRFRDFLREEAVMWAVFEAFVANFYHREQSAFSVSPQATLRWDADASDEASALLPVMKPDLVLRSRDRVLILDTKFYKNSLSSGSWTEKFHSANLYQMFAYLKNAAQLGGVYERAEGVLLYPTTRVHLDHTVRLQGHPLRLYTLDLARPWHLIHDDLLGLLGPNTAAHERPTSSALRPTS